MARYIACICGAEIHRDLKLCNRCHMKRTERLLIKVTLICAPLAALFIYLGANNVLK